MLWQYKKEYEEDLEKWVDFYTKNIQIKKDLYRIDTRIDTCKKCGKLILLYNVYKVEIFRHYPSGRYFKYKGQLKFLYCPKEEYKFNCPDCRNNEFNLDPINFENRFRKEFER
ncbi:MAG: hypothetical protein AMQ74_01860 [Candidatus Methanofastidiosum methylothiophilum]|uniref:Uncharacterized protein n=1 Tax=Candidatus Methanofastidiosum methylothiophilum TaxID=1705564 RepID=A0A150IN19_9EURY|nr:MAG: hypothetical protein AMQ74_01860 [Candidatus Methanofastidiosum methylthiophilus]